VNAEGKIADRDVEPEGTPEAAEVVLVGVDVASVGAGAEDVSGGIDAPVILFILRLHGTRREEEEREEPEGLEGTG
jgi:hypothetical protein